MEAQHLAFAFSSLDNEFGVANDDRAFCDEAASLFAVANASGPTYGGYHRPETVDLGCEALLAGWAAGGGEPGERLRQAFAAADRVMTTDYSPTDGLAARESGHPLRHSTASITAAAFAGKDVVVGQVGNCRAYRWRSAELELLIPEHSIGRSCADLPAFMAVSPAALLGSGEPVQADVRREQVVDGDLFLLCSGGLWGNVHADTIERVLRSEEEPAALVQALTASVRTEGYRGDITALLVACVELQ